MVESIRIIPDTSFFAAFGYGLFTFLLLIISMPKRIFLGAKVRQGSQNRRKWVAVLTWVYG